MHNLFNRVNARIRISYGLNINNPYAYYQFMSQYLLKTSKSKYCHVFQQHSLLEVQTPPPQARLGLVLVLQPRQVLVQLHLQDLEVSGPLLPTQVFILHSYITQYMWCWKASVSYFTFMLNALLAPLGLFLMNNELSIFLTNNF